MGDDGLLTDRQLRSWLRCRRRAWLDRHGDPADRRWNTHRELQLLERERRLAPWLPANRAGDPRPAGEQLAAGPEAVPQLLLRRGPWRGRPTLLLRRPGASRLGAFGYVPVLLQPGRHGTREHRLTLAFWGRLLEPVLGRSPGEGLLLDDRGGRERVRLDGSLQPQLDQALERLGRERDQGEPPELTSDRRKCVLCCWRRSCDRVAEAEGHLSQVSGIGGKRREQLQTLGIVDRAALAGTDGPWLMDRLEQQGERRPELALELIAQARCQEQGRPERLDPGDPLPELAGAPGVLIYDIESDPDARDDFLHGFLPLSRRLNGRWPQPGETHGPKATGETVARFHPLLALQEHGEARLWRRLRTLLQRYPSWPVLHYGETESINLLRLAERQGASPSERQVLKDRLIDVHQRVRQHWLLPVNSYGLKAVAGWRGFRWSQSGVDGARCLLWWRQWRLGVRTAARSRHQLRRIFTYNRDDCLATWAVAAWLLEQDES
ncbi:MAG: TM0106 family RecB-like putative nuclease [Cyanobacteriota bacterium]